MKKGYKQTEVGVIPDDWNTYKIKDACKLINGRGFKPFEWKTEGLPIIRIQNLNGSEEYNYFQGIYDKKLEVENGQLLFAWSGSRGTSFGPHIWKGEKSLLNYHTWKVVVDEKIVETDFFLHTLKQLTKFIESKAHGASALVHTQKWEMEGFEFSCPPTLKEQTAIATALSDTDALISGLEKLIAKKRNIKQGAMQRLLAPKEGWAVKKLGEIADVYSGGTPNTSISSYYGGSIKWITSSDLNKGFIYEVDGRISSEGLINSSAKMVKTDTLLVALYGATSGVSAITKIDASINQAVLAIKPNHHANSLFLFYKFQLFKDWIIETYTQGGQPNLSGTIIKSIEFSFPNIKDQTHIAKILSDMDNEITALESKLEKYKKIKQGMMQNLLTGKVRLI